MSNRVNGVTIGAEAEAVATVALAAPATEGTCRWRVRPSNGRPGVAEINGEEYTVAECPERNAFALLKHSSGECHYVTNTLASNCSCPDWQYRRERRGPLGCKHVKALRALLFGL